MATALAAFATGVPCPPLVSAVSMPELRHLPSGLDPLDHLLGGGFVHGMVTEVRICIEHAPRLCEFEGCNSTVEHMSRVPPLQAQISGEAGAGKTQLLMQLAIQVRM